MRPLSRLALAAAPPLVASALGGLAAGTQRTYRRLDTPSWAPPSGVFGPAWTALYTLNGIVGWRIAGRGDRAALALHLTQLALNAAWSPLFFGAGRRKAAVAVNLALDAGIVAEMALLARRDRTAAVLLAPYLAWCGYATALGASVAARNADG